jgi:hypothetical protein
VAQIFPVFHLQLRIQISHFYFPVSPPAHLPARSLLGGLAPDKRHDISHNQFEIEKGFAIEQA